MHRHLGRSHETTFGTRQLERRETSLHSDTQHGVKVLQRRKRNVILQKNFRDIVQPILIRNEGSPGYDEIRKKKKEG